MTAKNIYCLLAVLLGCGMIIGGFIVFGESLEDRVRILDIVVSCLIFAQFMEFTLFPLVNLDDSSHKEVGMMGIHFTFLNICSVLSIGIMIYGIAYETPFKYQMMGQLLVLFILLIGRFFTLHSGEKVQQVHKKEKSIMEGKLLLKKTMEDFMDDVACVKELDPICRQRLSSIHESLRFLSPSSNVEAKRLDNMILQSIDDLRILMRNTALNKDAISDEIDNMERKLSRRKKY